ncbi:hypothetical protein [Pajaroellobacter abortibovis]
MNPDTLQKTITSKRVIFCSWSRYSLWKKG